MFRPILLSCPALAVLLAAAALTGIPFASAQDAPEPQPDWMIHVDGRGDSLRFIPSTFAILPGGTVQLMIFGNDHGKYSLTLDDHPELSAEVDTSQPGSVHVAEFQAPLAPGTYAFHDRYHPSATGTMIVSKPEPVIGVGNGYDTTFYPARLEVDAGETFRFTNNASEIRHTLTALDGAFDSGDVRPGDAKTLTAPTEPGEYAFECIYHEGMTGTLVVRAAAADAPPATATTAPAPETQDEPEAESTNEVPAPGTVALIGIIAVVAIAIGIRRR